MDLFIQNLIAPLSGVIVGSILTCWLTYGFQKKLLKQQLDAQEKSHQEILKAIHETGDAAKFEISSAVNCASQRSLLNFSK